MHAVTLILGFLAIWPQQAQRPVLVLTDKEAVRAAGWSVSADGHVQAIDESNTSSPRTVESPLLLDAENAVSPPIPSDGRIVAVRLAGGEIVRGKLEDSATAGIVRIRSLQLGALDIAVDQIISLSLGGAGGAPANPQAKPPCVILANGDVVPGKINGITPAKVTIDSEFGETATEIGRVVAILMPENSAKTADQKRDRLEILLGDGQRLLVDRMKPGGKAGVVVLSRKERDFEIPISTIRQIVFLGTTVRELVFSAPPKVETTPYLDGTVAVRIDDGQHRRPRIIGQRGFADGITSQPRSRITWQTAGNAAYLVGWVGMDPARGANGICDVRIESEGKTLLSIEKLTARDGPRHLAVPLTGLKSFTLVTDFGPRGEVGDWVNWCEMRLVSK